VDAAASRRTRRLVLRAVLLRRRLLRRRTREIVFIIEYGSILGPVLRAQCYVAQRRPAASRGRGIVSDIALSRSPRVCSETVSRAGSFPSRKRCLILRGHAVGSARAGEVIECAKMEQASVCKRWGEPSWGNAVARYKRRNSAGKFLLTGTSQPTVQGQCSLLVVHHAAVLACAQLELKSLNVCPKHRSRPWSSY
jgi:hypothetical protein